MPDPTMATVSATQASALYNTSPYTTRWMLYRHFSDGMAIDAGEDQRMRWGKLLQPLVLAEAATQLRMEVRPNSDDTYHRRGALGCTRDATVICPDRGPGAMETKCVFEYRGWMQEWNEGRQPPKYHELQLQVQMAVGDESGPYQWGIIVAWVCGELKFFERKPMPDLWARMEADAAQFLADVHERREPDPFGAPVELPWLNEAFPVERGKVISAGEDIAKIAVQYRDARERQSTAEALATPLRAQLLAYAKDAEHIDLPMPGSRVTIRPHGKGKRITVFTPESAGIPEDWLYAG